MQKSEKAEMKAFGYHQSGFHCAEAVSKAIVEIYGDHSSCIPKVASAFGGGIGRSKEEICGGLSGAFIGISYISGRSSPDQDWSGTASLVAELRQQFIDRYKTTKCESLLANFGPQENMMRCKKLSGEIARMAADLLEKAT